MHHFFLQIFAAVGDQCTPKSGGFLGFPAWFKYLHGVETVTGTSAANACLPKVDAISDIWLIVAAIIEILLRIAGLAAIAFIIYGGFQYMSSRGEPGKTSAALQTIINALIGLVIAIGATLMVTFLAGRF